MVAFLGPLSFASLLWGVGFVTLTVAGCRDRLLAAMAALPAVVVTVLATTLAQVVVSFPFGWTSTCVAALTIAVLVRLVAGRWLQGISVTGQRRTWPYLAALSATVVAGYTVLWCATGADWEVVSQTWDALFDTNAIRNAFESGVVSPVRISDFVNPDHVGSYYPSTFHALGVLAMQLTGTDAVVASNLVSGLIAGALWPSVAALAAIGVVGVGRLAPGVVVLASGGFWAMPWAPLGFGVLWASALAAAFVPLVAVWLVRLLAPIDNPARSHWRGGGPVAPLAGSLAIVALLHPRILMILLVLTFGVWSWWAGTALCRAASVAERRRAGWLALGIVVSSSLFLAVVLRLGRGNSQFGVRNWEAETSLGEEVLGYLIGGPGGTIPQALTALSVLVGLWVAWRQQPLRALAVFAVGAVSLDVLTASVRLTALNGVTRFWYGDRFRTMAVAGGVLVVVAAVGGQWLHRWAERQFTATRLGALQVRSAYPGAVAALVLVVGTFSAVPSMSRWYSDAANDPVASVVSADEVQFFRAVAEVVPEDARILNNPTDGSALLYAYVNRKPAFFVAGNVGSTPNAVWLRGQFSIMKPADLCRQMNQDGIRWVINNGRPYSSGVIEAAEAPALAIPPGFPLVTERLRWGDRKLFELTGC